VDGSVSNRAFFFGRRLKSLREKRDLTQEQLAAILSVKPSAIGNYEQGTRQPDHAKLLELAKTYYIEVELDSSGDIESKIRSYEDYLEDHEGWLVVVCKKKRIADRIRKGRWAIPVKVLDIVAIKEQWAGA